MNEVSLPVIGGSTSDVVQITKIKKEFPFSERHSHELPCANLKLSMEEKVKSEATSEVSVHAIGDSAAGVPNLNKIKEEFSYSEPNSHGKREGTGDQLVGFQIKSETPEIKFGINGGNDDIKLEQLVSDELNIKDETDPSSIDQTKEKYTEAQDFDCDLSNTKFTCKRKQLNNHTDAKSFKHNTSDCKCSTQTGGPLNCSRCNYGSAQMGSLREHLKSHIAEKPFKCCVCNYACVLKSTLQEHMRTHTGEKPFKCSVCDCECVRRSTLKRHMYTHADKKPFKCSICDYECTQNGTLQQHMYTHTGEKPFKCSVCDYKSVRKSTLQQHMYNHTGEKPFKCSVCDYECTHNGTLQQHMRIHTGEKPFKCSVCDCKFLHKSSLKPHMRTHTGEKPFKCSVCNYRCTQSSGLQIHLKTHTGGKPFHCNNCDYKSAVKGNLGRHIKTNHT